MTVDRDEHPRATSPEKLAQLRPLFQGGTVTAGNASGINDGAAALLLASERGANAHGLEPVARVLGMAVAGVPPRIMGIGPVPATYKLLDRLRLTLADDDPRINTRGGAIALGHPLGMSGARLALTALDQLRRGEGKTALCAMCIGVGQGIALALEALT